MAEILKPTNLSLTWASGGDILDPGTTKYATGWQVEIPPRQWFNYLDNRQDEAIAHINQHGIPVWDDGTEYQADKSYVQGPTNGTIYQCILTHTNQDPEADVTNTYWIIAFAAAGTFYTKTESDNLYLAKANNLSDLTNTATARTNLSVYSQAQTYTKTEVDNKTTIASTAQAQAWSSNSVLLTPLRLVEALQGSNQSLSANGYQKLPGGFVIQWGTVTQNANLSTTYSFPVTFPTVCTSIVATKGTGINLAGEYTVGSQAISASQFTIANTGVGVAQAIFWIAVGY